MARDPKLANRRGYYGLLLSLIGMFWLNGLIPDGPNPGGGLPVDTWLAVAVCAMGLALVTTSVVLIGPPRPKQ